jgi:undecaprenyl pyrophosphate synthase
MIAKTKDNTAITVTIGLNYGGREEILRAVNRLINERHPGEATTSIGSPREDSIASLQNDPSASSGQAFISEEEFASYLYTVGQPDPDLVIRTSGEERLSGFLPWQSVYSELYFPEVYWPEFNEIEFEKALDEFETRKRRFGK